MAGKTLKNARALVLVSLAVVVGLIILGLSISSSFISSRSRLILATTTSTQNSGLLAHILPDFESKYNVHVDVVAVGTGQALEIAKRGDADVVLAHAPSLEVPFVQEGYGLFRWRVMYNQFAIAGTPEDPAGVGAAANATDAFTRIYEANATFVSRTDNSGTYVKETEIWLAAGLDPSLFGSWYKKVGKGMEEALQMAEEMRAYILTDEGTFFSLERSLTLRELFRNDDRLFNQYSVIPVSPEKSSSANVKYAVLFAEWLVSPQTQELIASYRINGHQLFHPNAERG